MKIVNWNAERYRHQQQTNDSSYKAQHGNVAKKKKTANVAKYRHYLNIYNPSTTSKPTDGVISIKKAIDGVMSADSSDYHQNKPMKTSLTLIGARHYNNL